MSGIIDSFLVRCSTKNKKMVQKLEDCKMPDHADRTHLSNIINANNNELYSTSTNNFPYNVRHVKKEGRWPPFLPQIPMPLTALTKTRQRAFAFYYFYKKLNNFIQMFIPLSFTNNKHKHRFTLLIYYVKHIMQSMPNHVIHFQHNFEIGNSVQKLATIGGVLVV